MDITNSQAAIFKELTRIMGGVSVFVSFILGFLILYANRFLIRRRKKEFGVYMILGMEKGTISRILITETVLVGLLSLVTGLASGVLLSQGMSVVTAKLMGAPLSHFQFVFSPQAFGKTILYFAIIFLFILLFNTLMVSKQKLIDLLYANKKNERFKTPPIAVSVLALAAGIGCLVWAYYRGLTSGFAELMKSGALPTIAGLCIIGTFLFFFSLSGVFMKLLPQNRNIYLKNLNMFVLRQIGSKINTTYVSMTMVCLILFISLSTLASGMGLASNITKMMRENTPFDATVSAQAVRDKDGAVVDKYPGVDLVKALGGESDGPGAFAKDYLAVRLYDAGVTIPLMVTQNNVESQIDTPAYFMKLSDYNRIMKMEGQDPIALKDGEYAVNYAVTNADFKNAIDAYMKSGDVIKLRKTKLRTTPENLYRNTLEVLQNQDYNATVIVDDSLVKKLPPARDVLSVNYPESADQSEKAEYDKVFKAAVDALDPESGVAIDALTASEVDAYSNSTTMVVSYLAIYLGVIFLITAAAVLAIGQLSEISDNIGRYALLRKIGTDDKMLHRSIFTQNLIYFGAPMLPAVVHAAVGVTIIGKLINLFGKGNIFGSSLFVAAVFLVIYGGYFLATYHGSKNILNRESILSRRE
jgi:putative ABC transport system permease protein